MTQPTHRAVLTGDIIRSSRLSPAQLASVRAGLTAAVRTVKRWKRDLVIGKLQFYRGDGWQLLLDDPALAMRAAVPLRASLLAQGLTDTRISTGLGELRTTRSRRTALAMGQAFVLSGHGLDERPWLNPCIHPSPNKPSPKLSNRPTGMSFGRPSIITSKRPGRPSSGPRSKGKPGDLLFSTTIFDLLFPNIRFRLTSPYALHLLHPSDRLPPRRVHRPLSLGAAADPRSPSRPVPRRGGSTALLLIPENPALAAAALCACGKHSHGRSGKARITVFRRMVCLQPFAEPGCPARAIRALSRRGRRGLVDPWTHARPGAGPLRHAKWDDIAGLAQEGRYLGRLELILVFLLVPIEQPNGIGFLIAAKSILRFGEIKEPGQRKVTEYIIIGTFISFGWALFSSVLTQKAIKF